MSEKESAADKAMSAAWRHWKMLVGAGVLSLAAWEMAEVRRDRLIKYETRMQRARESYEAAYQHLFKFDQPKQDAMAKAATSVTAIALNYPRGLAYKHLRHELGSIRWFVENKGLMRSLTGARVIKLYEDGVKQQMVSPTDEFMAVVLDDTEKWEPLVGAAREYDERFRVEKLAFRLHGSDYENPGTDE